MVSIRPTSSSRGGATGNRAKITMPIAPETNIAFRVRRKTSGWRVSNQTRVTTMTGQ